jgi:dihydropteroate synthase
LHNARQTQKRNAVLQDKIDAVKDIITEAYGDSDDQETLRSIAEALDIALTRTIEWSATIEVSGTMELDLLEDSDTDVEQEIYDNLSVDTNHGNIEVIDQEVTNVREN